MELASIFDERHIVLDVKGSDKDSCIRELVQVLAATESIPADSVEPLIDAILEREADGSTGLGRGLAVPHVKNNPLVNDMVGVFGRHVDGLEFDAVDGEPVSLIFLMASPQDGDPGEHLRALKRIMTLSKDDTRCRFIREARNEEDVLMVLRELDEEEE